MKNPKKGRHTFYGELLHYSRLYRHLKHIFALMRLTVARILCFMSGSAVWMVKVLQKKEVNRCNKR